MRADHQKIAQKADQVAAALANVKLGKPSKPSSLPDPESGFESEEKFGASVTTSLIRRREIFSDMAPMEVSTKRTVAASFLGEDSRIEAVMYEIGVKNELMQGVLWSMWYIGAITGMLAVAEVVPVTCVWASVLMLPLPVVTVLLLSTDLLAHILISMDLYIIYILQFALFVDGILFCQADLRRIFWYCFCPTMIASGLVDAYSAKYRPLFAKLFFSASICILVSFNFLMIFKWQVFGSSGKLVHVSFALHHISDQLTLFVFYCRHLWCSVFSPEHYVMIKADVRTRRHETVMSA